MLMSIIQQYMSKNVCSIVSLVFSRLSWLSRLGFLDSLDSSLFFRKFIFYMVPRPENIDSLKNSLSLEIWLMKNWKEEKDPRRTKRIRYDDSGKGKSLTRVALKEKLNVLGFNYCRWRPWFIRCRQFNHLRNLLERPAAGAIRGLPLTAENYVSAKSILKKRFGQPQVLTWKD